MPARRATWPRPEGKFEQRQRVLGAHRDIERAERSIGEVIAEVEGVRSSTGRGDGRVNDLQLPEPGLVAAAIRVSSRQRFVRPANQGHGAGLGVAPVRRLLAGLLSCLLSGEAPHGGQHAHALVLVEGDQAVALQSRDDSDRHSAGLADHVGDDIDTDRDIQDGHSSQGPLGGLVDEGV